MIGKANLGRDRLSYLSSLPPVPDEHDEGGGSARKAGGVGTDLSHKESRFLEETVKQMIRRAAELVQDPGGVFPPITLADLPDRS